MENTLLKPHVIIRSPPRTEPNKPPLTLSFHFTNSKPHLLTILQINQSPRSKYTSLSLSSYSKAQNPNPLPPPESTLPAVQYPPKSIQPTNPPKALDHIHHSHLNPLIPLPKTKSPMTPISIT
ncbi:hypothetical protein P167DRAFT_111864 [Morchella conica CCBAS932]|uniref:Uncharacterized protein n=1 Tax=Morchella conica CCBAS932 TaxID=1392247 RepID=A0A3N4KS42_9PEZI|nr:hypothetical protein P167DRAFT_111864 [Morchella conica CCBAS932]